MNIYTKLKYFCLSRPKRTGCYCGLRPSPAFRLVWNSPFQHHECFSHVQIQSYFPCCKEQKKIIIKCKKRKNRCSSSRFPSCRNTLYLVYLITLLFILTSMGLHGAAAVWSEKWGHSFTEDILTWLKLWLWPSWNHIHHERFLIPKGLTCSTLACWQRESLYCLLHVFSFNSAFCWDSSSSAWCMNASFFSLSVGRDQLWVRVLANAPYFSGFFSGRDAAGATSLREGTAPSYQEFHVWRRKGLRQLPSLWYAWVVHEL